MRTSLARSPSGYTSEQIAERTFRRMKEAWIESGIPVLPPEKIPDPWRRQIIIQEAERLYGKRA